VTFFVDKELVPSCLGLAAIYFCASVVFSSENDFSPAAGEMYKYFLDGKNLGRGEMRRGEKYFRGRNAGGKNPEAGEGRRERDMEDPRPGGPGCPREGRSRTQAIEPDFPSEKT